jgi:hypothetical protein
VNWTIQEQLWDGEAKARNELKTTCGKEHRISNSGPRIYSVFMTGTYISSVGPVGRGR